MNGRWGGGVPEKDRTHPSIPTGALRGDSLLPTPARTQLPWPSPPLSLPPSPPPRSTLISQYHVPSLTPTLVLAARQPLSVVRVLASSVKTVNGLRSSQLQWTPRGYDSIVRCGGTGNGVPSVGPHGV